MDATAEPQPDPDDIPAVEPPAHPTYGDHPLIEHWRNPDPSLWHHPRA